MGFLEPVLKTADRVPEERQGTLESGVWPCGMWVGPGSLRGILSGDQLPHISCYSAGRGLQELSEITSLGGSERDCSWLIKTLENGSCQDKPSPDIKYKSESGRHASNLIGWCQVCQHLDDVSFLVGEYFCQLPIRERPPWEMAIPERWAEATKLWRHTGFSS